MEGRQRAVPPDGAAAVAAAASGKESDVVAAKSGTGNEVRLERRIGLISGVALIAGTMIGSGIFVSPKGVAEGSGSVGLSLISWVICGVISMCGGLAYAELGTTVTQSGAEYAYLLHAFRPLQKVVGPIPAFLYIWMNTVMLRPASMAIVMLTFATYATEPFYDVCNASLVAQKCLAALGIIVLTLVNTFSVRLATGLQNVLTFAKLLAIGIILIGCLIKLGQGSTKYLANSFENTETNVGKIAIGFYKGMWAYDGWNNLNYVTEELINPYVNLPRAVLIAVPLVTACYLLINVSFFTVMSVAEMLESPAVALTWGHRVLGVMAWLMPLSVVLSTFGSANGTLFSTGRLNYVAGREGHSLELLSMVHVKKLTPMPSLLFQSFLSLIFIIPGNIGSLIDFFNFAVWFFYGGTMAALLVLRYAQPGLPRPFKIPIVIPIFVLLVSAFLVVAPIIDDPRLEFLYAFLFIVSGLIFYVPFVHYKMYPPFMGRFTAFFQLLMEVMLPTEEPTT